MPTLPVEDEALKDIDFSLDTLLHSTSFLQSPSDGSSIRGISSHPLLSFPQIIPFATILFTSTSVKKEECSPDIDEDFSMSVSSKESSSIHSSTTDDSTLIDHPEDSDRASDIISPPSIHSLSISSSSESPFEKDVVRNCVRGANNICCEFEKRDLPEEFFKDFHSRLCDFCEKLNSSLEKDIVGIKTPLEPPPMGTSLPQLLSDFLVFIRTVSYNNSLAVESVDSKEKKEEKEDKDFLKLTHDIRISQLINFFVTNLDPKIEPIYSQAHTSMLNLLEYLSPESILVILGRRITKGCITSHVPHLSIPKLLLASLQFHKPHQKNIHSALTVCARGIAKHQHREMVEVLQ
ncbi:hypothetical protein ADUPG1_011163, partial [Aduncisulcus paluster]